MAGIITTMKGQAHLTLGQVYRENGMSLMLVYYSSLFSNYEFGSMIKLTINNIIGKIK